jgi:hypothetical protein
MTESAAVMRRTLIRYSRCETALEYFDERLKLLAKLKEKLRVPFLLPATQRRPYSIALPL